jgi:chitin disaccharide deacetylase
MNATGLTSQSQSTERRLVVTGDDFGLTPGVNRGIVYAHTHGVLTHASLMATTAFTADAIDLALGTPSLSVGLHLVLVDGRSCLPSGSIASLVDAGGRFRPTAGEFVRDWSLCRIDPDEVEHELRAQIEHVLAAGLHPTHLDSHKHLHMWPPIFQTVVRLACHYEVPAIRIPVERPVLGLIGWNRHERPARAQAIANALTAPLAWLNRLTLDRKGLDVAFFVGRVHTGLLSLERLKQTLERLPPGRSELMTHPGFVDGHLARVRTRLRDEREREVALLCARETREVIERAGVVLAGPAGRRPETSANSTATLATDGRWCAGCARKMS